MALIKSFMEVPPGGWKYVQPETGVKFKSDTFEGLAAQVKAHREYKGISTDGLEMDIQRQLCVGLTTEHCRPEPGEVYRPVRDLSTEINAGMAASLANALVAFVLSGAKFVEKEEAERRAKICRGCPFNKPANACACAKSYSAIEAMIPAGRRLDGISVCTVCGCSLQAKANLPLSVVQSSLPADMVLPPWCWQGVSAPP